MNNDPIKAKIIKLVPEILVPDTCGSACNCAQGTNTARPITLADVLRAYCFHEDKWLQTNWSETNVLGWFEADILNMVARWNKTTTYDGQTQEVKTFIGLLLGL